MVLSNGKTIPELIGEIFSRNVIYDQFYYVYAMLVAIVIIIFIRKKYAKTLFIAPVVLWLALVFNPLSMIVFDKVGLISSGRYYRFIWMIPIALIIAFVIVYLLDYVKNIKIKALYIVVACVLLVLLGNFKYTYSNYQKAENIYKIPNCMLDISQAIHEDFGEGQPVIIYNYSFIVNYRTYDPGVIAYIGRYEYKAGQTDVQIREAIKNKSYKNIFNGVILDNNLDFFDSETMNEYLDDAKIDYIIVDANERNEAYYTAAGLSSLGIFGGNEVFRNIY